MNACTKTKERSSGPVVSATTATAGWLAVLVVAVVLAAGCGKSDQCCDPFKGTCGPCPLPGAPNRSDYADVQLEGPNLPFGLATDEMTVVRTVTVRNLGNAATTRLALRFEGVAYPCDGGGAYAFAGGAYPGVGGTCGASLGASASCTVAVAFAPAGSTCGDQIYLTATYALPLSSAMDEASYKLMLNGNSTGSLGITLTPDRHDFGNVPAGATRSASWTATNTSGAAESLDCTGFILGANDAGAFAIDAAGGTCCGLAELPAGGACTLDVQFSPPSQGPFQSYLTFIQVPGAPLTNTVELLGQGTP